jgi:hypothetical protein
MSRPAGNDSNPACHDSFLDVVTNIVGILIILVVVAGLRAKNAPVHAALLGEPAVLPGVAELQKDLAAEQSVRQDVYRTAGQIQAIQQEALLRSRQRAELATVASVLEHQIKARRDQLDAKAREDFDLGRGLSEARLRLEQARQQRGQVEAAEPEPIVVQTYPTPLSKTVDADEAHFQLRNGRIAFIPLGRLIERFKSDVRRQMYKLLELPEISDTVGPEGGFRLRYTMERKETSVESQMKTGRTLYAQLEQWTLIPVASQMGEPIEAALAEGSNFRQSLAAFRRGKTTVTLWVYPDSFAEFRALRKEIYHLGFPVAGRPLPAGAPIGGSPEGSKSAAE